MKRQRRDSDLEQVELIGIPHYSQGDADGLCVYYAMSMMLAALHPALGPTIHDAPRYSRQGSPVLQAVRRLYRSERLFKDKIADWFFNGMSTAEATRVLNELFQHHFRTDEMYFTRRPVRARRIRRLKHSRRRHLVDRMWTVQEVLVAIARQLPVIVTGGGLGLHAVLAIGYSARGRADRSLCFLDPALVRPDWWPCGTIFTDGAEAIMPNLDLFREYRPARVITEHGTCECQPWEEEYLDE